MTFSAYNAGDCHGPSGLAMTNYRAFQQSKYGTFLGLGLGVLLAEAICANVCDLC